MIVVVTYPKYFKMSWSKTIWIVWLFSRLFCGNISQLLAIVQVREQHFCTVHEAILFVQACPCCIYIYVCFLSNWYHEVNGDFCCLMMEGSPKPRPVALSPDQGEGGRLWRSEICVGCRCKVFLGLHRSVKPCRGGLKCINSSYPFCFLLCLMCVLGSVKWKWWSQFFSKAEKNFGKTGGNVVKLHADALQKLPRQRAFEEMDLRSEKYHVTLVKIGIAGGWRIGKKQ